MAIESAILNRLRGTGVIKHFGTIRVGKIKIWKFVIQNIEVNVNLVWNHIYALYYGLVFGVISGLWYVGLFAVVSYLVGEAKGWGEWIGNLTRYRRTTEEDLHFNYKDNEGKKFPFIHQISNFFIKEQTIGSFEVRLKQYFKYATLALIIRGIYWWLPIYLVMAYFEIISYIEAMIIAISLGLSFPIACKLGKLWNFNKKIGILNFSIGWENQEIIYGFFQGLALWYVISKNILL